jgi:hypothetical protein
MLKNGVWIFVFLLMAINGFSQPILPDFSLKKGDQNQRVLAWRNGFGSAVAVLNIQRSADSVSDFRTIYSAENPQLEVNAWTDTKPVPGLDYYRIFYSLTNGMYYFTKAQKVATGFISFGLLNNVAAYKNVNIEGDVNGILSQDDFRHLCDSLLANTSDSLLYNGDSTVIYKKYNAIAALAGASSGTAVGTFISNYLYLNVEGNVVIHLPENEAYQYSMTIYNPNGTTVLYKIDHFDNPEIILSKSSFVRAGYYPYELFKNGKLEERNSFGVR